MDCYNYHKAIPRYYANFFEGKLVQYGGPILPKYFFGRNEYTVNGLINPLNTERCDPCRLSGYVGYSIHIINTWATSKCQELYVYDSTKKRRMWSV
jgi:hypothetical protein